MIKSAQSFDYSKGILVTSCALATIWTLVFILFFRYSNQQAYEAEIKTVTEIALDNFNKDLLYRRWCASHGGVYVPVTEKNQPNPYLISIIDRDIKTTSGKALTLVNPAYMIRQVHEIGSSQYGLRAHITSLKPLRPSNAPDTWEIKALDAFSHGTKRVASFDSLQGERFFRFMQPLITEKACLKCHASQGYQEGDIRGGISVSVPWLPHNKALQEQATQRLLHIGVIWLVGMIGIFIGFVFLRKSESARAKAHSIILKSQKQYFDLIERTPDLITKVDAEGRFVFVNHASVEIFGLTPQECIGKVAFDFIHPDDHQKTIEGFNVWLKSSFGTFKFENRQLGINGQIHDMAWIIGADHDESGKIVGFSSTARDITESRSADSAFRASEEKYRSLVETAQELVWKCDANGCFTYLNPAWEKSHGYKLEEMLGKSFGFFQSPEVFKRDMKEFAHHMAGGFVKEYETTQIAKDGHELTLLFNAIPLKDSSGTIIGTQGTAIDITVRKQLEIEREKFEHQRNQMQKLESLGVLAGGIAHDFNNLMGGIFGYIDNACESSTEEIVKRNLTKAMNTIDRARALTQQLLTFAKGGAPIQEIGHLFPFVEETAKFALSGSNVSCNCDVPQDLWACNFDKNQIGQVIDNLIINAQQAMPVGGTIELSARNIILAEKEHPLLINGRYVKVTVKDSGVGIPAELISKIFDPFFTTKAKGHGLGLATCYSIINRHGGCIDVESEQGKGSTFKVYLPAAIESASSIVKKVDNTHKGSGTFLIMDDEEVMRDTIGDMLENLGYSVVSKENGKDAIDFYASETKANRKIAGIIFDLTVPGSMGGKAAIEEIRKLNTEIPAFVASGYADDPVMKKPAEHGFTSSICKPFRKSELSEMLNKYMQTKK